LIPATPFDFASFRFVDQENSVNFLIFCWGLKTAQFHVSRQGWASFLASSLKERIRVDTHHRRQLTVHATEVSKHGSHLRRQTAKKTGKTGTLAAKHGACCGLLLIVLTVVVHIVHHHHSR